MSATHNVNTGDIKTAIQHAMGLLSKGESQLAREQAQEILRHHPDEINSMFVVAAAVRVDGDKAEALQRLEKLIQRAPDFALAQQELGFAYAEAGQVLAAIEALQRAVAIEPQLPASWKLIGELFLVDEDERSAAELETWACVWGTEEHCLRKRGPARFGLAAAQSSSSMSARRPYALTKSSLKP